MSPSSEIGSNDRNKFETLILKLADGEMSHQERSSFLSGIGRESDLWRGVALAFVEKQLLEESLRESSENGVAAAIDVDRPAMGSVSRHWNRHLRIMSWIVSLASCLFLGVLIGQHLLVEDDFSLEGNAAATAKLLYSKTANAEAEAAIGLEEALSRSVAPVPSEFRRALMKAGYSLEDQQTIANVSLPTGGKIEVPVRRVDVTYVGLNSFQ